MPSKFYSAAISFLVALFMLYFPYEWCKRRHESEIFYGLKWFLTKKSKRDVIIALAVTLIPLTIITFYWPVEWGGRGLKHPSFWNALDALAGGIAAAFIEETFFRGWLQTLTVKKFGVYIGIFITTLLFALSHLIVLTGWLRVATFFPGLVMAILRHRGGSVLPSIIYHAVCNVWAVWLAPVVS
ncbi:MAG: CPBP family intramembrane metalloprotease [Synergistaceae bacterium]|nr:CPBP family intramembrane metalloprotease [Synergistaceae bacterium]